MASERKQNKSESLIMRYVSEIIRLEVKNSNIGFASVVACKVTPDLSLARIYVSFLNTNDPKENLKALNDTKGFIRARLAGRLEARKVPDIQFILDDSLEKSSNLENILKNIQK